METATLRLIEAAERLDMTGEIGDGTVARFHELAALARLEQQPMTREQALRRAHWDFDQAVRRRPQGGSSTFHQCQREFDERRR